MKKLFSYYSSTRGKRYYTRTHSKRLALEIFFTKNTWYDPDLKLSNIREEQ